MKEMILEEIKKAQLEILVYVDKICKENNIKYTIAYGTLLGAIRHKGFIPWDDDIDIMLVRDEYEKLLEVLYQHNGGRYKVFSLRDKGYYFSFAKITDQKTVLVEKNWPYFEGMGAFIDIFPVDYVKKNEIEIITKKAVYYTNQLQCCLTNIWYNSPNIMKRIVKYIIRLPKAMIARAKGEKYWKNQIDIFYKKCNDNVEAECLGRLAAQPLPAIWNKEIFENYTEYTFEDYTFMGVKDYDKYLSSYYGDYMKLPPVEKRNSGHDFIAYWKENGEYQDEKI